MSSCTASSTTSDDLRISLGITVPQQANTHWLASNPNLSPDSTKPLVLRQIVRLSMSHCVNRKTLRVALYSSPYFVSFSHRSFRSSAGIHSVRRPRTPFLLQLNRPKKNESKSYRQKVYGLENLRPRLGYGAIDCLTHSTAVSTGVKEISEPRVHESKA